MVKPKSTEPAGPEAIVGALENVAQAARALTSSRLKPEAVALLISKSMRASIRVSPEIVINVLEAAERLDASWLKPLPAKKS